MRVGIIGLLQESNTFLTVSTEWEHFLEDVIARGDEVRERFQNSHHEIGGFFAGLDKSGIEAVPLFVGRALPRGAVSASCWNRLMEEMDQAMENAGKLDGILAAPHGATVAKNAPDADGFWLGKVKARFPRIPIIATADPHGNYSPDQAKAVDAIFSYQSNPHLDQFARGLEAAQAMNKTLAGNLQPKQAACFLPLAVNIASQNSEEEPLKSLVAKAAFVRSQPGIAAVSIFLGFPYADVANMGAAVSVTAHQSQELAEIQAADLARFWWDRRADYSPRLLSIPEAIRQIQSLSPPVCVCDMGDNAGGGSPADGTLVALEILKQNALPAFVSLFDPKAVVQAQQAGIGAFAFFSLGGQSSQLYGSPIDQIFKVVKLSDGKFTETNPTHGAFTSFDQGPTAVLRSNDGLTVMVTTKRMVPFSLNQLYSHGINPLEFKALVVKGVHAPLAAYMKVCKSFVRVNSPGVTTADLSQLHFKNRRKLMFPFEPETPWAPVI